LSGTGEDDVTTHDRELNAQDYVAEILRHGTDAEPGTEWHYSNRAANGLAAVLSEALRRHDGDRPRSLLDYARQKPFDPLGVETEPAYTGLRLARHPAFNVVVLKNTALGSEYDYVKETVLVRVTGNLSPSKAKAYLDALE
jgi:CubicO group peptidase (beta-lactamase class C family)